jgi:hypothetical protein
MLRSLFHSVTVLLGAILLLVTLWDGCIFAESTNHIVSAIRTSDSNMGQSSRTCKPVLRSVDDVIEAIEYQRCTLLNVLTTELDHSPLRYLLDQSRVVLANTDSHRMKCSIGERAVRYAQNKRKEVTSSPSFPHFIAGIAAGVFLTAWSG